MQKLYFIPTVYWQMYRSVVGLGFKMIKTEGFRGFYRGLTPALTQVAPYSGFQFAFYTMLEKLWLFNFKKKGQYLD